MNLDRKNSPEVGSRSPSTAVTTPEQDLENNDDIWDSDGHSEDASATGPARGELLSDLPTIKRQHMTDGYREGLAIGKAKVMQKGFDDGYPIGIQIALRVGKIIGVLEGYLATKSVSQDAEQKNKLEKLYERAREELSCPSLLKDVSDDLIADSTTIPPFIDTSISKWEILIFG